MVTSYKDLAQEAFDEAEQLRQQNAELLAALEQAEMDYGELLAYMRAAREPWELLKPVNERRDFLRKAIAKAKGE